jgi:predicted small secreted protein
MRPRPPACKYRIATRRLQTSKRRGLRGAPPVVVSRDPFPEASMTRPLALLVALALALAACNTVRGVGQDMSAAGRALDETADELQRGL